MVGWAYSGNVDAILMMSSTNAPVALFVYNRPLHLQRVVESLQKNFGAEQTDLYIFSDGPKDDAARDRVVAVRKYVRTISGFRSVNITEHEENRGLANSIISGVSALCEVVGRVIVLEDDLVTSPYFLSFMNAGLERYAEDRRVASVLGYSLPLRIALPETYFVRGADCYGWATWRRAWDLFEVDGQRLLNELERTGLSETLDMRGALAFTQMLRDQIVGRNHSWAVRWHVSMFLRNMLTLTPGRSLIINIGADGSGTNFGSETLLDTCLTDSPVKVGDISVEEHLDARAETERYYRSYKSLRARLRRRIHRMFY